jgi:hypothetical protein
MAFIKQAMSDAKEAQAVPEGEYDLRVVKKEVKEFKSGRQGIAVQIAIEDPNFPNAGLIFHNIMFTKGDDNDVTRNMMLLGQRRFLECFGIPYEDDGFDDDDLEGATGRCLVTKVNAQKEDSRNPGKYIDIPGEFRNELQLPRLKSGDDADEGGKPAGKKGPASKRR